MQAVELLQNLIQFDTTNPPGNEEPCVAYVKQLLETAGLETQILAKEEGRPNLVARLPGQGTAPPLLLYGHVDVVTTEGQSWSHPPFGGDVVDGYVWGRGALDMKGAVAMMVTAFLRAKQENIPLPGDVVLAVLSDEEAFGAYGAKFLVDEHDEVFQGIHYAIGEAGGFTFHFGGRRLYPIMVAEKQACSMRATVRGRGGHGAMPVHGEAMAKLARALRRLDRRSLPMHVTPVARAMIEGMAAALPSPQGAIVRQLLNPALSDMLLGLLGARAGAIAPMLHDTVSPTMLRASDKINVIPAQVSVGLDGRLLPGHSPDDMLAELGSLLGPEVELAVELFEPGPPEPDMGLFGTLADILREGDAEAIPVPFLMAGVTDGRHLARLGIQTYGFTPMKMPSGFDYWALAHGADERLPVDALEFGVEALSKLLTRFGEAR